MSNKEKIIHVCLSMLFVLLAVDRLFAQIEVEDIPGLTAKGKKWFPEIPDFTRGGEKNDKHDWNLGPTGARGWMWGLRLRTDYARQILITKVDPGSPAEGILQVDDVILGINGKKFDSDARIAFGKAITEAEKAENRGLLELIRWRKGKTENVTLRLKIMGTYGSRAPMNCRKSQSILDDACRYIEKNGFRRGIMGHVGALGLLASGQERFLPMVRDYAHKIQVKDAYQMSSWNMSYMNIFLSEYYLLTGDKAVLPKIREMALYLANGQSRVGTWGHNNAGPDGILRGYGAMCQPTLSCAVSLVLNRKCGIDDPVVEQAIRKAEIFFLHFVDKGNIPYGDHSPREVHDSNGRNSLAVILFDLLDNPDAYWFYARMTVASYGEREEGHTGNYWGFLWGPLGAMRAGPEAAAAFIKELEWFFDLERRWDGGFTYQGGANMDGAEHTTPGWDTTGARILMYAMSLQKLHITGKGLRAEKALTGKELEDTLLAGQDYSTWFREGYINTDSYDALPSEELLERLNTWSPPMRIRAAKALAKKPGDFVGLQRKMLASKDRDTILGGIYGLEYQRQKAEPAIDDLVGLLTHDDVWVRFRAGCALCGIGSAARDKAVPVMLRMATRTFADDPREMNQRYISYVLWGDGLNGSARGLLRRDMNGVDQDLLVPAIKKMIRNEDGLTRSFVSRAIRMMSFEELAPLWPDVIYGLQNPAPSGIMFNADIRETCMNVLVKYRFKEAVPYIAEYVRTMKQHGSENRIYRVMDTLRSYGAAAKPALSELYRAREYYRKNLGPGKPLEFPTWALNRFMKGLNEGIKAIEEATETPTDLRSIQDFLEEDTGQRIRLDLSLMNATRHSMVTAFRYFLNSQQPNGSWKYDPAITALVLTSFMLEPQYNPDDKTDEVIRKGYAFLETFVKPDGGIYHEQYRNYSTAVGLMAFAAAGKSEYRSIIENAREYLITFQLDEGEEISPAHAYYGGIGYGGDDRPDLSNLHLALEAIKTAGEFQAVPDGMLKLLHPAERASEEETLAPHWQKALVFLIRTQNIESLNDMDYATDDGGFVYETGHYKPERSISYGSMTYAGLKSLLYAGIDKNDIRVRKAYDWIRSHYTVEENPNFGTSSLYYYFMTATKCLTTFGGDTIVDSKGNTHYWREDFLNKIISLQHEEGYWINPDGRYQENVKDLATAYSVIAMKHALQTY
jgi:hypothetical protein